MSEPFIGEIRMFAGTFAPQGWAFCDGQLLAVSQNDALFSLLGTIYGGDGRTTFGLPDLRGRIPVHAGTGPGLSPRQLGMKGGTERETLTVNQMPAHSHPFRVSGDQANTPSPADQTVAQAAHSVYAGRLAGATLNNGVTSSVGGSQPHTNMMPFLCVNFIIALFGIYPSRN